MQPTLPVATTAGAGTLDVRKLAIAQLRGDLRLQDVVAAGGAAAQMPLGDLAQLESRLAQQAPRQRIELLAVLHGAGGVIGDHRALATVAAPAAATAPALR